MEVGTVVKGYIPLGTGDIEVDIFALELIHPLLLHLMIWIEAAFSPSTPLQMRLYDRDRDPDVEMEGVTLVEV